MINRLCPNSVKFAQIGDICTVGTGSGNRQDATEDGRYPFFVRSKEVLLNDNYEFDEEAILIPGEGGIGDIFHYYNGKYALHQRTYRIHPTSDEINTKFLYYYMFANFKKFILMKAVSATVTSIRKPMIETFEIPIPPMEVQNRIVEVLDKMTALTAELEAELEARKQQYEYYRNKLLTFNDLGGGIKQVIWKKISEIAQFPKARIKSEMLTVDTYVGVESLIKNRGGKTSSSSVPEGVAIEFLPQDILIGNIRPYLKKIWLSDCQGGTNGDVVTIRVIDTNEILPRFLYYILASDMFFDYDNSHAKGGKMPRGDKNAILAYNVPVPSIEEQERIVSILDRFEALTTDLQIGLPAEIEARRQQYEYYRNKLLTFEQAA